MGIYWSHMENIPTIENTALIHRLNRIQGQIEGLKEAIGRTDEDCLKNMGQVKAVHSAIKHFAEVYVEAYALRCAKKEELSPKLQKDMRTIVASAFLI
jgi:DNA-binding FrmR family transcriptional regulator